MASKLNEGSEFTIPLKNLLGLVAFTAVSVWAYFGIIERLAFLEHEQEMMVVEIEENDTWIDNFEPPKTVQENFHWHTEDHLCVGCHWWSPTKPVLIARLWYLWNPHKVLQSHKPHCGTLLLHSSYYLCSLAFAGVQRILQNNCGTQCSFQVA